MNPWVETSGDAHLVASRLEQVRRRIEEAARRCGRAAEDVTVVAVTKGVAPHLIRAAYACGQRIFGENRVQEMVAKQKELAGELADARWHLVGHLQRNKVKDVVGRIDLFHALDSLRLAQELNRRLEAAGLVLGVLLEVNVSGEPTKFGVAPDQAVETARELTRHFPALRLEGLMTVGPHVQDEQVVRRAFRQLRQLFEAIRQEGIGGPHFRHLSMGMSADFPWAVEEGATLVRIGTAIFGPRPAAPLSTP